MKTVAEAKSAPSARMRVPVRASLELYKGGSRLGLARLDDLALTHRVLRTDPAALSRVVAPVEEARPPSRARATTVPLASASAQLKDPGDHLGLTATDAPPPSPTT